LNHLSLYIVLIFNVSLVFLGHVVKPYKSWNTQWERKFDQHQLAETVLYCQ